MTTEQAWSIVGNQPKSAIKNMVRALSMLPSLNTPEENRRLEAGKICLKTQNPRFKYCRIFTERYGVLEVGALARATSLRVWLRNVLPGMGQSVARLITTKNTKKTG